jgi:RimJ/RimL family protein N-acetyltransferase
LFLEGRCFVAVQSFSHSIKASTRERYGAGCAHSSPLKSTALYYAGYKANYEIFEKIPEIDMGSLVLRGLVSDSESEAAAYFANANNSSVKKYLPNAYAESEEAAFGKIHDFARSFLLKKGILFAIALKENPSPIGYILCNSPLQTFTSSEITIDEWSIDFWLAETARDQGIMRVAINSVLNYLKEMGVTQVFAFADKKNGTSINLLRKCNLEYIDDSTIQKMMTFAIKL